MNIGLIYKENNYNFDLKKDISIKYLKDLSSKLINKDSLSFDLFYNNNNLSNFQENTPIKNLSKNKSNIDIIIKEKSKHSVLSNENIRKIKDFVQAKNNNNSNNIKALCISPLKISRNSRNQILNNFEKKINKLGEYISENEVFEEVYNLKENEILNLMKEFSQKIKEYDNILYKKFKNNSKNNEVLLYEKIIIEFKDKQINFLQKLMKYFKVSENYFFLGEIPLSDFYSNLANYNSQNKEIIQMIKENKDKTFPLLLFNKIKNHKYFLSQSNSKINSNSISEKGSYLIEEKNLYKNHFNNDKKYLNIKNLQNNKEIFIKKIKVNKDNFNKGLKSNTDDNSSSSQSNLLQGKIGNIHILNHRKNCIKDNLTYKSKSINSYNLKNSNKNILLEDTGNIQEKKTNNSNDSSSNSSKESKKEENEISKELWKEKKFRTTKKYKKERIKTKKFGNNIYDFII